MIALHVAAALFALSMLVRHAPAVLRHPGGSPEARRARLVAVLIVALAVLILATAVKALARALI